jgi:hypothetical protein
VFKKEFRFKYFVSFVLLSLAVYVAYMFWVIYICMIVRKKSQNSKSFLVHWILCFFKHLIQPC